MTTRFLRSAFLLILAQSTLAIVALAAAPKVLPEGKLPNDHRLEPLKDLDGYFPFTPPTSRDAWEKRAERVRRQILISQGLWPMPAKTPLNAVIHGKTDRGDYTVEKVYFESAPGFFVTGNLYRPKNVTGKAPGVMFAHGHWSNARLSESTDAELRREIADGEERFEQGGRSRFQSMCVQLARMGCVVWQWDMLGNSDSQQLSMALVHGFAKQRPEMNTVENWGLFSPQAEAHLQSAMGLQTLNAVRSLDFLLSLPEVDPSRIAITGASGGGTQTMLLAAVDPRVTLSFPAVMVSTAMQGGCTCENASLLRVNTGNIEFAGLFAPKPQGMTCANDWTKEMATKGFPELKQLYTFLGAPNNVMLKRGEHFPHNYNAVSRSAFYGVLNTHFKLGLKEPVIERDYQRLTISEMSVWDAQHPQPPGGPDFERALLRWLHDDAQKQLREMEKSPVERRKFVIEALEVMIGRTLAEAGEVEFELKRKEERENFTESLGLLRNRTHHEELPAIFLSPKQGNGRMVLWLDDSGKAGLYDASGAIKPEILLLVRAGVTVVGVDLLYQGEFLETGEKLTKTRRVSNPREAAAYTFGYNHTVFAQRVHDILTIVSYVTTGERKSQRLDVVGLDDTGALAAAARALADASVTRAVVRTGGFKFQNVRDLHDPNFLPGGAKYGDVAGMLALSAPSELALIDTIESKEIAATAYRKANAADRLTFLAGPDSELRDAVARWLLRPVQN